MQGTLRLQIYPGTVVPFCLSLSFQLNTLSRENEDLRRQLKEERSMRRPRASPSSSSTARSLPPSRRDGANRYPKRAQGSGESQTLGEELWDWVQWRSPSGRSSDWDHRRRSDQMKPPEVFDLP